MVQINMAEKKPLVHIDLAPQSNNSDAFPQSNLVVKSLGCLSDIVQELHDQVIFSLASGHDEVYASDGQFVFVFNLDVTRKSNQLQCRRSFQLILDDGQQLLIQHMAATQGSATLFATGHTSKNTGTAVVLQCNPSNGRLISQRIYQDATISGISCDTDGNPIILLSKNRRCAQSKIACNCLVKLRRGTGLDDSARLYTELQMQLDESKDKHFNHVVCNPSDHSIWIAGRVTSNEQQGGCLLHLNSVQDRLVQQNDEIAIEDWAQPSAWFFYGLKPGPLVVLEETGLLITHHASQQLEKSVDGDILYQIHWRNREEPLCTKLCTTEAHVRMLCSAPGGGALVLLDDSRLLLLQFVQPMSCTIS